MSSAVNGEDKFKDFIFILLCTWGLGILVHGYRFYNLIYSMDSMLVFQNDDPLQFGLGRFMVPLFAQFRGRYYPPSVIGIVSLTFIAVSVYLITRMFDITNRYLIVAMCAVMATNSLVIALMSDYICFSDIQLCALVLIVTGVYLTRQYKYGWLGFIPLCIMSMGLYQAYLQVGVTLFIALALYDLARNKEARKVIAVFLFQMIVILAAGGLYYLTVNIVNANVGIPIYEDANSIGAAFKFNGLRDVFGLVTNMYRECISSVLDQGGNYRYVKGIIIIAVLLSALILLVKYLYNKRTRKINSILIIIGLIILPAGMTCVYVVSNGYYHILMRYSHYIVYSLAIAVVDRLINRIAIKRIMYSLLVFVVIDNMVAAGNQYIHKDMIYQSTMFNMTRIIDRLEQTEGYEPGKPVVFAGDIEHAPLNYERDDYYRMTGSHFYTSLCYYSLYERYFQKLLGYPIWVLPRDTALEIERKPEVEMMPVFPAEGCIKQVDDVFVVKISNVKMEVYGQEQNETD
ncbi:MAG: glucosyltransferase domain-containing protein [Lachnospiraceae bacterium]|nr:glucosyltransferase domain-containing protein [Lachnospiraceae bacterium]